MTAPDKAAEKTTAPEVNPPAAAADPAPEVNPPVLGDAGKQAIDRMKAERDTANAERTRLSRELQEIKDRDLSDLERTRKAHAETTEQLNAVRRQNVLLAKGISPDLNPPAATAAPEEWSDYADRLLAWRGSVPAAVPAAPAAPRPDQSQGARPDSKTQEDAEYAQYRAAVFPNRRSTP